MSKVGIIGVGQSKFTRAFNGSIRELAFEAFREAMLDARLGTKDIDASIICSRSGIRQAAFPVGNHRRVFRLESAADLLRRDALLVDVSRRGFRLAYSLVKIRPARRGAGGRILSENVGNHFGGIQERMGRGADIQWESPFGTMMPSYYALHARRTWRNTERRWKTWRESASNRRINGALNEKAVLRQPLALEAFTVRKAGLPIPSPVRCGPRTAARTPTAPPASSVASEKKARALSPKPGMDSRTGFGDGVRQP